MEQQLGDNHILLVSVEFVEVESGNGVLARSIAGCLLRLGYNVSSGTPKAHGLECRVGISAACLGGKR